MDTLAHLAVADGVATITLDSPHNRNALSRQLVDELLAHLAIAAEAARVVVMRAEGPVFCAGADMAEAAEHGMAEGSRALVALQRAIVALPVPVVVRLHGPVRAGGLGIVAAADVVVAAAEVSFAFTEVRLGLAPAAISLTTLPRLSDRAAAYACLTGDTFSAEQAVVAGLVTRAVPVTDLDAHVSEVVDSLRLGSPQGLRETKALLNAPLLERIDRLGPQAADQSARLFASEEARQAMRAFLDRRR